MNVPPLHVGTMEVPCTLKAKLDGHTPGQSADLKPYRVKELNPASGYLVTSEAHRGTLATLLPDYFDKYDT